MLNIIEPKDHNTYQSRVDSFLDLLKVYQSFALLPEEKENATFIIGSDNKGGVYGGAVLYKQNVSDLYKNIGKIISNFQSERKGIWVARLGLYTEHGALSYTRDALHLREHFYQNLLKIFIEFGKKENLDFLVLTLCSSDSSNTKHYGYWPYILEIKASDSSDDLFHGILSLDPQKVGGGK